jgi:hypothetical protein
MAAPRDLVDTNILVRLVKRHDPEFALGRGALRALLVQRTRLCYRGPSTICVTSSHIGCSGLLQALKTPRNHLKRGRLG